jgi:hypothetical protein
MTSLEELVKQRDEAYLLYDNARERIEKAWRCVEKMGKDEILKNNANNYRIISAKITEKRAELEEKTEKTIELKKKKTKSKTEQIKARKKALESGSRSLMSSIIMTSLPSPTLHGLKEKNEYKAKSQQYRQISGAGKNYIEEAIDKEFGKNEALYLNNYFQQVEKILAEEFGTSENERIDNFDKLKLTNEFEMPQEKLKKQLFAYSITFINVKSIFASDNFIRKEEVKKNELEKDYQEKNNLLTKFLVESVRKAETKTTILEEKNDKVWDKLFPAKQTSHNIYDFDTYYHWIGWYVFLVFTGYIARKVYRIKTKKRKESKNYLVEIRKIFQEWQLNMYASTGAYVAGFFLIQQAIAKWINPRISNWLNTQKAITISVVCLFIGIGFYLDGIITSSLKTPLQRLGIRIENSDIDEKTKKSLLSKTQQVSELFKETLKRFGLLAVVGILTKLIEAFWNKDILSYLSYAVPIAGAIKIIWEVDKSLKKLKLGGKEKNGK